MENIKLPGEGIKKERWKVRDMDGRTYEIIADIQTISELIWFKVFKNAEPLDRPIRSIS